MRLRPPDPDRKEPWKFAGSGLGCDLCGKEDDGFHELRLGPLAADGFHGTGKTAALVCSACWNLHHRAADEAMIRSAQGRIGDAAGLGKEIQEADDKAKKKHCPNCGKKIGSVGRFPPKTDGSSEFSVIHLGGGSSCTFVVPADRFDAICEQVFG